jgi:cyanate permease
MSSPGRLGGAIGPFLGGWLFDVTGSYRLAFLAACVAVAGSAVAAWFAAQPIAGPTDEEPTQAS